MNEHLESIKKLFCLRNILLAGVALFVFLNMYECPFEYFFGLSCAGCGMTRAVFAFLRLDIADAFYYHPLFPIVYIFVICFILEVLKIKTFSEKTKTIAGVVCATLFILVYLVRLFSGSDIVTFNFETSALARLLE